MTLPLQLGPETLAAPQLGQQLSKLKQTSQDMEAQFVKQMLQAMNKTVTDPNSGSGFGKDEYQDMFDDAVSKALSQKTGLGIAQTVYKHLEPIAVAQICKSAAQAYQAKKSKAGNP